MWQTTRAGSQWWRLSHTEATGHSRRPSEARQEGLGGLAALAGMGGGTLEVRPFGWGLVDVLLGAWPGLAKADPESTTALSQHEFNSQVTSP
jgi:hypothetical protein